MSSVFGEKAMKAGARHRDSSAGAALALLNGGVRTLLSFLTEVSFNSSEFVHKSPLTPLCKREEPLLHLSRGTDAPLYLILPQKRPEVHRDLFFRTRNKFLARLVHMGRHLCNFKTTNTRRPLGSARERRRPCP